MEPRADATGKPPPYGRVCGFFVASVVTLIGILRSVSPEMILLRAFVAGLVAGVAVRCTMSLARNLARNS